MPQRGEALRAQLTPGTLCRALICAAALGGYLFTAAVGGADMGRLVLFYLCAAVYLVGPGLALADWLGPHEPGLKTPLAMLYGIGSLAAVHCLSVHLGVIWLLRVLPAGITLVWLTLRWRRCRRSGAPFWPRLPAGAVWKNGVVLWALLCLLYGVMMGAPNPHPLAAGAVDLDRDLLWNAGNVTALSRHFPADDIRFAGVRFSYHYLTELLAAALCLVSGAAPYDILAFFAGPLFLAGELAALCSLGRQYFGPGRQRAAHSMVYLLFGCQSLAMGKVSSAGDGIFGNTLLKHLITNINSQATALILLCAFMALFSVISRQGFNVGPRHIFALLAAFALLCLAKGPQAAIVLCSFAVTAGLLLVFQKPRRGRLLMCLAACGGIFALLYTLLFASGASSSMSLSAYTVEQTYAYRYLLPWADRLQALLPFTVRPLLLAVCAVLNSVCLAPFHCLLWAVGLPAALRHLPSLDPPRILANGVAVGGLSAYHLFYHTSSSQVYFAFVALLLMALLAAEQLERLLARRPLAPYKWPVWLAGAAAALTAVCIVGACSRQAMAQLAATLHTGPSQASEQRVAAGDEAAMRWLAANSGPGLVFATNRVDSSALLDDGISNVYSAFGGRQGYMEGWKYAYTNMGVPTAEVTRRLEVGHALFDPHAAPDAVRALCEAEGIDCLSGPKPGRAA